MNSIKVGKVVINDKIMAKLFGYEGGHIRYISISEDLYGCVAIIQHPDMPEVQEGGEIPRVDTTYFHVSNDFPISKYWYTRLIRTVRVAITYWKLG